MCARCGGHYWKLVVMLVASQILEFPGLELKPHSSEEKLRTWGCE